MDKNYKQLLRGITTFIFDVDGVLTNNQVLLLESGALARSVSIRDGFAIKTAIQKGYQVSIITGGKYEPILDRFKALGVEDVFLGVDDKTAVLEDLLQKRGIHPENVLYMGDDIPDQEVMEKVGLPSCPKDAVVEIKNISKYVSDRNGGEGCIRDVIQQTLKVQEKWPTKPTE